MARTGITFIDVQKAALIIQERNQNPTVDAIRAYLGTGSRTTISNYLRQWREEQPDAVSVSLPEQLGLQVQGLFGKMLEQANLKADIAIQEMKIELNSAQEAFKQSENENKTLSKSIKENELQIDNLKFEIKNLQLLEQNLKTQNAQYHTQLESLNVRLSDLQSRLKETKTQAKHAQENLEHFRAAVGKQRAEEKITHEREVNQLIQEIGYLKQQEAKAEHFITELKSKLDFVHKAQEITNSQLESLKQENKVQQLSLVETASELKNLQIIHQELQENYKNSVQELKEKDAKINHLSIDLASSKEKLNIQEAQIQKCENINNTLQNDKLFLTQENIELKLQLKNFQKQVQEITPTAV
ncbi:MAG: hypothetical protein JWM09_917 [Francisellaceae bacterium]|nr:hypothetical protein [Francisellaceae bacterium]